MSLPNGSLHSEWFRLGYKAVRFSTRCRSEGTDDAKIPRGHLMRQLSRYSQNTDAYQGSLRYWDLSIWIGGNEFASWYKLKAQR